MVSSFNRSSLISWEETEEHGGENRKSFFILVGEGARLIGLEPRIPLSLFSMSSDAFTSDGGHRYVKMQSEPTLASSHSFRQPEHPKIFDELPKATIVSVSRPDASDISPVLLSYTIEVQYRQVLVLSPPFFRVVLGVMCRALVFR